MAPRDGQLISVLVSDNLAELQRSLSPPQRRRIMRPAATAAGTWFQQGPLPRRFNGSMATVLGWTPRRKKKGVPHVRSGWTKRAALAAKLRVTIGGGKRAKRDMGIRLSIPFRGSPGYERLNMYDAAKRERNEAANRIDLLDEIRRVSPEERQQMGQIYADEFGTRLQADINGGAGKRGRPRTRAVR